MPGDAQLDLAIKDKGFVTPTGRRQTVLHDVHITISPGQILALLGRSGTGKSTLLRIASGLDTAFDGHARRPSGHIGMVFQDPRLLPWLTVADNVRLVAPRITAAEIDDLLALVELPGTAQNLPSQLSLGMARRVALARALAVNPNILFLDEPFASLDRQLGVALAAKLAEIARRIGSIMMFATHELEHALAIADRICVLDGQPTTLRADIAILDRDNAHAIDQLRTELLGRFAFLGSDTMANPF